jgi:hypothetical protein
VQFCSRVNLPFVSQVDGKVDASKLPVLAHWSRNSSIETVLVEIRKYDDFLIFRQERKFTLICMSTGKWQALTTESSHNRLRVPCFERLQGLHRSRSYLCIYHHPTCTLFFTTISVYRTYAGIRVFIFEEAYRNWSQHGK